MELGELMKRGGGDRERAGKVQRTITMWSIH